MVFLRRYNVTLDLTTAGSIRIRIPLRVAGESDFATGSNYTPATGDVKVSKNGGAQANIGTLPTYSNGAWEFTLTGTELSARTIEVAVVDSATKAVDDEFFVVETFGHASAMYPADYIDGVRNGLTALPNAAADAAGGLPISDAGGLDLDAKLANTNEVTAARMGALTDWIDGGRLDLLLDGVKAKTDGLPSDPADQSLVIAATDAITAAIAALNNLSQAQAQTAAAAALTAFGPPTVAQLNARTLLAADYATASVLARALGLVQDNWVLRDPVYVSGNLTGATIRVYDTAAHATTDDGTGLLYSYTITNTYTGTELTKSTQTRVT
jgi:hypothetical protein